MHKHRLCLKPAMWIRAEYRGGTSKEVGQRKQKKPIGKTYKNKRLLRKYRGM